MNEKIDIRSSLHVLMGYLRRNNWVDAYELLLKMSKQMDDEYYRPKKERKKLPTKS